MTIKTHTKLVNSKIKLIIKFMFSNNKFSLEIQITRQCRYVRLYVARKMNLMECSINFKY